MNNEDFFNPKVPMPIPTSALRRFADGVEKDTNPDISKFISLNRKRIDDFVEKPYNTKYCSIRDNKKPVVDELNRDPLKTIPGLCKYPKFENKSALPFQDALEFQTALGPKSRFGDGDGTFFDLWLNGNICRSKHLYDSQGLPLTNHSTNALSGFKNQYKQSRLAPSGSPVRVKSIKPYAQRRKERLEKEEMEKAVSEGRVQIESNLSPIGVSLQDAFERPSIDSDHASTDILELDPDDVDSYFGDKARACFFDYYRQLHRQKNTIGRLNLAQYGEMSLKSSNNWKKSVPSSSSVASSALGKKDGMLCDGDDDDNNNNNSTSFFSTEIEDQSFQSDGRNATVPTPPDTPPPLLAATSKRKSVLARLSSTSSLLPTHSIPHDKSDSSTTINKNSTHVPLTSSFWSDLTLDLNGLGLELNASSSSLSKSTSNSGPISARTRFLVDCVEEGIDPRPSLLLRKEVTSVLNISNQAMGDRLAEILSHALKSLPALEELNISDNNLTDSGLRAIILALRKCFHVKRLNISRNKVDDEAARALFDYISSSDCNLVQLVMQNADIDDVETSRFLSAIAQRNTIEEIDLSGNLLGSHETSHISSSSTSLATIRPLSSLRSSSPVSSNVLPPISAGATTTTTSSLATGTKSPPVIGGDSIGELLRVPQCSVRKLILSWNKLRGNGAYSLSRSLHFNRSLLHLDLSFNSLGGEAGEILGDSLHCHPSLQYLNISSNNLRPRACVTIISGIRSCQSLTYVDMSENSIGEAGTKALINLNLYLGDEITVDVHGCSVRVRDSSCWFDLQQIKKSYRFDVSLPYDRAACIDLMRLIPEDDDFSLTKVSHIVKGEAPKDITLYIHRRSRHHRRGNAYELSSKGLEKLAEIGADIEKAKRLFREFDVDGNGSLDRDELSELLSALGLQSSTTTIDQLLAKYDVDGSGVVEEEEFADFLSAYHKNITRTKERMSQVRYFSLTPSSATTTTSIDPSSSPPAFLPPDAGIIELQVKTERVIPDFMNTLTSGNMESVLQATKGVTDSGAMIECALKSTKISYAESQVLFRIMLRESGDKIAVLQKLVPRLVAPSEVRLLIQNTCGDNLKDFFRLQSLLGSYYRLSIGLPNGYYALTLSNELDRLTVERLWELNQAYTTHRQKNQLGDTSQLGDWIYFRNVYLDNQPFVLTMEWLSSIPSQGKLEFDFSSPVCASIDETTISDVRFLKLLSTLFVIPEDSRFACNTKINEIREFNQMASKGVGLRDWEMGPYYAKDCSRYLNKLYRDFRVNRYAESDAYASRYALSSDEALILDQLNNRPSSDSTGTAATTAASSPTPKASSKASATQLPNFNNQNGDSVTIELFAQHIRNLIPNRFIPSHITVMRMLNALEFALSGRYICCAQLAMLVDRILNGGIAINDYSTWRVDCIVMFFPLLTDTINFEHVLKVLKPNECAMLIYRLGWLHIWNPMKPEGFLILNLARREERQIIRMVVALGFLEPGENWLDKAFQLTEDHEPDPEWKLPISWATEYGLPDVGVLTVRYFSGDGVGIHDCKPDASSRIAFMSVVVAQPYTADVRLTYKPTIERAENILSLSGIKIFFTTEKQIEGKKSKGSNKVATKKK